MEQNLREDLKQVTFLLLLRAAKSFSLKSACNVNSISESLRSESLDLELTTRIISCVFHLFRTRAAALTKTLSADRESKAAFLQVSLLRGTIKPA